MQNRLDHSHFSRIPSTQSVYEQERESIHSLPEELIVEIFKNLSFKDVLSLRLVCRQWKKIASDSSICYGKYELDIQALKQLPTLHPLSSGWIAAPENWELFGLDYVLDFISITNEAIVFHAPYYDQTSRFFSFDSSLSCSGRYIYLGHYKNTFFVTVQEKEHWPESGVIEDLFIPRIRLLAIDGSQAEIKWDVSLLGSRIRSEENLWLRTIQSYFPLSDNKAAVVTNDGNLSFWDFSAKTPRCYDEFPLPFDQIYFRVGPLLISESKTLNLENLFVTDHNLYFTSSDVKTFRSSFCSIDAIEGKLYYFTVNAQGAIQKKWVFLLTDLFHKLDPEKGDVISFSLRDLNESFILLACVHERSVSLLILSTLGEVVHIINEPVDQNIQCDYKPFRDMSVRVLFQSLLIHLSENILIYKNPNRDVLMFWHIPTKKCLQKLDLIKAVPGFSYWRKKTLFYIQDMHFSNNKLTLLLLTSAERRKFQLIQFRIQT